LIWKKRHHVKSFQQMIRGEVLMYDKILVPHAGTSAGGKALEHATKLAKIHGSKVTILHIVEKIPTPSSYGFELERKKWAKDLQKAQEEIQHEMKEKFQKLANKYRSEKIQITVKIKEGYPDEEIPKTSKIGNYDLVIMAKRRKLRGFKSILKLGSVSRKVLEQISCPIILIDGEKK